MSSRTDGQEATNAGTPATTPRPDAPPVGTETPPSDSPAEDDAAPAHGTATWVEATDASGEVRADKKVPEPDSLGG
jgi:hypothetical protein